MFRYRPGSPAVPKTGIALQNIKSQDVSGCITGLFSLSWILAQGLKKVGTGLGEPVHFDQPVPDPMKKNVTLILCVLQTVLCLLTSTTTKAQQGITAIYTDFNGYWTSSAASINPVKPDNSHNLLGFIWNGQTFSTGVNDAILGAHGVSFSPQHFQAFPVRNVTLTGSLIGLGQLKDGIDNGASTPQPFTLPPNVSAFLTDGPQGLDIGTGVANIPTGTLTFDFGAIIDPTKIGDGVPDILVSQIAQPSAAYDSVYFTNAAGVLIGNRIAIRHTAASVPSVGNWTADFYATNGSLAAVLTKTDRPLRVWATDLSAFGITAANYASAVTLRYKLNGSSDPAFLAFNSSVIEVISANDDDTATNLNSAVNIPVLNNDVPVAAIDPASMIITASPAHGTTSVNPATGVITYTPTMGFSGYDQFNYQVCNGNTATPQCDEAIVRIAVGTVDLSVAKTVDTAFAAVGDNVVFTITAKNLSSYAGLAVVVSDLLPAGYNYISSAAATGTYNAATGKWTIGTLPAGASTVLTVTAKTKATGPYVNSAGITGALLDPDLSNNTASATTTVLTIPVSAPVFAAGPVSTRCQGAGTGSYPATAGNSIAVTYSLSPSAAGSINFATADISWNAGFNGDATITASATGLGGPKTETHVVTVYATPLLVVNDPAIVCLPGTVDLTAVPVTTGSSNGLALNYYTDAAKTASVPAPWAISANGTYYIQGTSSVSHCQSAVVAVHAALESKPSLFLAASQAEVCKGAEVALTGNSVGNTIVWIEAGAANPATVRPVANTFYHATATTPAGCISVDSIQVKVDSFRVKLAASPNPVLAGMTVTISTSSDFKYSINAWTPAIDFADQTAFSQTLTVRDTARTYAVSAVSSIGCTDTVSIRLVVDVNLKDFFIPNAFTPNGDGKNDQFLIYGSSVSNADLVVFNQWGERIYHSEQQGTGWDGNYRGQPQPSGVYVYLAKVTFYNGKSVNQKGIIHLVR